jgi:CheY-like chemotaxis protein
MAVEDHKILLVDDDDQLCDVLSLLLSQIGIPTVQAGNGREALERLHRMAPPALILLDMNMPVMDGRAFLRRQEQDSELRSIPVVMITGAPVEPPVSVPVLHKPLELQRLKPFLEQYCGTGW